MEANWRADALCKEHPEVEWFPTRGTSLEPARKICALCLVSEECLAEAIAEHGTPIGVRSGTSERERRQLRKAARAAISSA